MNHKEQLNFNPISIFLSIDSQISIEPSLLTDNACIASQNAIIDALIDNEEKIPKNCTIFSCGVDSAYTPHHWIEIVVPEGRFIWDRTEDKFSGSHFLAMGTVNDKNRDLIQYFSNPSYKMQIFPDYEE